MDELIVDASELRHRGFKALCTALGWANAVRFLRQYEPGAGNYTQERRDLLRNWDAATLAQRAHAAGQSSSRKAQNLPFTGRPSNTLTIDSTLAGLKNQK